MAEQVSKGSKGRKGLSRFQKASALLPLALLSGAWTTSLTVTSAADQNGSEQAQAGKLPDGTSIPSEAIKAPASVSSPGEIAPGVTASSAQQVISSASTNGIPSAALSAYQRAAQVIDKADKGCNIDWTLVAAIGRVESNHGRYGGNTLDSKGVSRPGIIGIPLDGSNGTAKIADSDAGQYDKDTQYDRAVGPMQFIPSTWSVVGVDGDGDGARNPQDIDDAALATAVYLCSGDEDLSTDKGQQSAIYRYNHSQDYVDLVMSIAKAYASGDFTSVPTSSAGTTTFTPDYGDSVFASGTRGFSYAKGKGGGKKGGSSSAGSSSQGGGSSSGSSGGSTGTVGGGSTPSVGGGGSDPSAPVKEATKKVTEPVKKTVTNTVSALDKAKQTCQANFSSSEISKLGGLDACGRAVMNNGLTAVKNDLADILGGVTGGLTGGGLG